MKRGDSEGDRGGFERIFLPHLDAAYGLARLLLRSAQDAEDVVQEAYLKAFRAFAGFRGDAPRPWLLTIVRNTAFTWLRDNRMRFGSAEYQDDMRLSDEPDPEAQSLHRERSRGIRRCIDRLPAEFREAIVLREVNDMAYRDIAQITGVPPGTVMSRLARARARLADCVKGMGQ